MPEDTALSIIVRLQDEASAALKSMAAGMQSALSGVVGSTSSLTSVDQALSAQTRSLTEDLANFMKQEEEAATAAENLANAEKDSGTQAATSGSSWKSMARSILVGMGAYNLIAQSMQAVKKVMEDSIGASMQESATLAQVKVDVQNAGESYATIGPQIQQVAQQNIALGFTYNDTMLSMGKLLLATGSYSDALKLNQLAMDLSRSKGIDLNTATVALQQVMAGNLRSLKAYGISLDSSTTSAQALDAIQQKLQGSSQAYASTSAGNMAEVQAQWQEMEMELGNALIPVLQEVFAAFEENLPRIVADVEDFASGADQVVTALAHWTTGYQYVQLVAGSTRHLG